MLASNHVLAGAAIGVTISNPVFAIPLALTSHIIMDLIPHWGKFPSEKIYLRVARIDGLLLLSIFILLYYLLPERNIHVIITAFAALFFDLDKPFEHFFGKYINHKPLFGKKFLELNIKYQNEDYSRSYVEITSFIILSLFILLFSF